MFVSVFGAEPLNDILYESFQGWLIRDFESLFDLNLYSTEHK